jgi:AcrR family transcriptional regulator
MPVSRVARKIPAQARSRETVDAILIAAARLFSERGWTGTTTNHVAAAAGVSVGSLYQYFPNKLALLAALKERFVADLLQQLADEFDRPRASLAGGLRRAIRTSLSCHYEQRALLAIFARELPARLHTGGDGNSREAPHLALLRRFLVRHRRVLPDRDPGLAALIVGEMVDAVTRSALRERPRDFVTGRLETELTEAALLYLKGR